MRERFAGPIAQRVDQWLVKAIETMHAARGTLPPVMLRYVFSAPETSSVVVGVLSPSRDQVGRDFPVTVFCSIPTAALGGHVAALPLAFAEFLDGAEALIREVPALEASEVLARLDALPIASTAALPGAAQQALEVLRTHDAREHLLRTLGDADGSAPAYAYYTLGAALKASAASQALVLDCPIANEVDLLAWLRLTEVLGHGRELPSFFWIETPDPRLLISLRTASTQVLTFVADPAHSSARLWPLTTGRSEVAEQVRGSMIGQLPSLEQPGRLSIAALIEALAQRGER